MEMQKDLVNFYYMTNNSIKGWICRKKLKVLCELV
jgi:hypothetical protein